MPFMTEFLGKSLLFSEMERDISVTVRGDRQRGLEASPGPGSAVNRFSLFICPG